MNNLPNNLPNNFYNDFYNDFDINDFKYIDMSLENKFKKIQYDNNKKINKFKKSNKNNIYFVFQCAEGFIETLKCYYHFLFSCFFPLFEFILDYKYNKKLNIFIYNVIGNNRRIIDEVLSLYNNNNINIFYCEKKITRNIYLTFNENLYLQYKNKNNNNPHYLLKIINKKNFLFLPSYDTFIGDLYYDSHNLTIPIKTKNKIINFMDKICNKCVIKKYKIVIIKRGLVDTLPRYISNLELLQQKIINYTNEPVFCDLFDNLTFCEQYKLINNTELVIAQHGSGLSNIIFMKPGKIVLELSINQKCIYNLPFGSYRPYKILDSKKVPKIKDRFDRFPRTHFINIANYNNLTYYFLPILKEDITTLNNKQINKIFLFVKNILLDKPIEEKYHYINNKYYHINNYNSIYWIISMTYDYCGKYINIINNKTLKYKLDKYFFSFYYNNENLYKLLHFLESISPFHSYLNNNKIIFKNTK